MTRSIFSRVAPIAFVALAGLGTYACSESTGPDGNPDRTVEVTVRPAFQPGATAGLSQAKKVHVVVRRTDGSVAFDELFDLPAATSSLEYQFNVALSALAPLSGEDFTVEIELITTAGTIVFRGGPTTFHGTPDPPPPPIDVQMSYTGAGAAATRVEVTPTTASVAIGATVDLTARAFDGASNELPGTPLLWSSLDPTIASVPSPAVGRALGVARGVARIRATLVTGATSDATVTVTPVPAALALQSGNGQSGNVGTSAALPLVVKATATDGLGVGGVQITFAVASGGGTLSATEATTAADGFANVGYTFGAAAGPVTVTATAVGLTGSPVSFTLTGTGTLALAFTTQPAGAVAGATLAPVVVEARDQSGTRVANFTGAVTLALETPPGGVQLEGTLIANAVAGVATFANVSVSAAASDLRLVATGTGVTTGTTSTAFTITPRPAVGLAFSVQPPPAVPAGDQMTAIVVQARDAVGGLATGYTGIVTLTLNPPAPAGVTLQGPISVTAVGGVATFTGLSLSAQTPSVRLLATGALLAGTAVSNAISVGPPSNPLVATPATTTFTVQRAAVSPAPAIVQLTSNAGPVTTLALGAIQYGPGAAGWLAAALGPTTTPSTLTLTPTTGTLPEGTFTATVPVTGSDGGSAAYSVTLTVTPLPVTQMVVFTQPSAAASGALFGVQPVIELRDGTGTRVTSATNPVTASTGGPGVISGTLVRAAVQGRATFTDLRITGAGSHTVLFNSPGLPQASSAAFTVNAALTTTQAVPTTTGTAGSVLPAFTPVTAAGGVPPLAFALSGGVLPAGLTFNAGTGQISGTPATPLATTTFTVTVTDAGTSNSAKTFQLTVNGPLTTTQAIPSRTGTQNTLIPTFTPVTAAGGTAPLVFALTPGGTLPTGMSFNTANGQVSGTPTTTLATTTFTVTVTDALAATSFKTFNLTVNTALTTTQAVPATAGTVGFAIPAFIPVTAAGGTAPITFALSGGALPAGMSFNTGTGQVSGTPTTVLATTVFTVTATDAATATSAKTFSLTVNPALTTTQAVPATTGTSGTPLPAFTPVTAAGGTPPYTFALTPGGTLPAGLAFNTGTGQITGTPTAPLAATTFTVTVTDAATATSFKTFQLTVNGPLTTTQAIPARVGTQGAAIPAFIPVTAAGGTLPYTFALSGGTLPTGMTFNTGTGQVAGTPTTTLATTTFTVTVTDAAAGSSFKTFDLTVNTALTTTQAVPATVGTVNTAIPAFTPVTAAGGTAPIAFALTGGTLPTGMTFTAATGQINGTPTTTLATTTFTVTATDAAGATSAKTFQLTVNGPLTTTQAIPSRTGTQNVAIPAFIPVTAAGGTAPRTFALSGGVLPTGMAFNTGTGQVTGTPTTTLATTTFTVTATDAVGATSAKTFDLTVNTALTTTQAVPTTAGTVNTAIPAFTPVTAAGGTAPITFALSGGTLPTGMTFSTGTGAVSGTPTTTLATTVFTVTATDAVGATSFKTFSLTVNPALTTTQAVPSTTGNSGVLLPTFTPVTAAGGTTPYAFALSGGTLPTGLAFNTGNGQISGTPTTTLATTTFTVTVTDAAGAVSSKPFNLTVNGPLTTTQAVPARVGTQNTAIPAFIPVTASGGTTPYAFALSGGTLPTGMTFNTGTGQVSGTPTTTLATTTFTVTVTDAVAATSFKTFDLTVNTALATTQAVPTTTTTVGTAVSFTPVTAAGGTAPIAFALSGGTLPTGVGFNTSSGLVSGTPTVTLATTVFTVTATDAAGATSFKTFSFTVNAALSTTQAVPATTGVVNTPIPAFTPVTASGGNPPYAFALSGGTLPTGMSFNTGTGQVTGTPSTTLATTTFTVTVTDAALAVSAKTFDLTVNALPPSIALLVGATPTASVASGANIAIPLNVDMTNRGTDDLASLTVTINWDPTKFTFNSEAAGNWPGAFVITNTATAGQVSISGFAALGATANFNLWNITLQAIGAPSVSSVTASVNGPGTANQAGNPVTVTPRNLTVTITP